MCFSATVSLTAAAVLGVVGIVTVLKISSKSQLFVAAIPLLFCLQQISEGMIWLYAGTDHTFLLNIWKYFYLSFALLIWPIWIPMAFAIAEKVTWRQIVIGLIFIVGCFVSLYQFYYVLKYGTAVGITGNIVVYQFPELENTEIRYPYISAVILPFLISSLKQAWKIGIVVAVSLLLAYFFFYVAVYSVWCFFASIISFMIYFVIRDNPDVETDKTE